MSEPNGMTRDNGRSEFFDAFMMIDGIEGESQDSKHSKQIQVSSFQISVGTAVSQHGGGQTVGKAQLSDLTFTHLYDKSSPKLFVACATGAPAKKAVLTVRKAGKDQQDYLVVTMQDVIISQVSMSGSDGIPTESVSLNYTQINYEYKEQKADGSLGGAVTGGFNVKTNKKV